MAVQPFKGTWKELLASHGIVEKVYARALRWELRGVDRPGEVSFNIWDIRPGIGHVAGVSKFWLGGYAVYDDAQIGHLHVASTPEEGFQWWVGQQLSPRVEDD